MTSVQFLLQVFKIFCGLGPFKYLAALFQPFIQLPILGILLLSISLIFAFAIPVTNGFNHNKENPDSKSRDLGYAFSWAFLVYYILVVLSASSVLYTGCEVAEKL